MLHLILGHLLLEMRPWNNYTAFPYLGFLICSSGIHIHFVKIVRQAQCVYYMLSKHELLGLPWWSSG